MTGLSDKSLAAGSLAAGSFANDAFAACEDESSGLDEAGALVVASLGGWLGGLDPPSFGIGVGELLTDASLAIGLACAFTEVSFTAGGADACALIDRSAEDTSCAGGIFSGEDNRPFACSEAAAKFALISILCSTWRTRASLSIKGI